MKKFCAVLILFLFFIHLLADDGKQILAVMEFEDRSGNLSEKTLSDATEYIRGAFVSSNKFLVIAKERQEKAMIAEMKKESYKACNDKNCQIPLGQALSADTILRTTINFFGGIYTITSELIDLAKEATVSGAKEDFDGSETAFKHALDKIVEKIVEFKEHKESVAMPQKSQDVQPIILEEKSETTKSEPLSEEPHNNETAPNKPIEEKPSNNETASNEPIEEKPSVETYHPYKIAGISLMVAGAVVAAAGVAGFHIASDKEYGKYKAMATDQSKPGSYSSIDKFLDAADSHRKKSNIYRALEITSGIVGGTVLFTGVVLLAIKKEKAKNFALTNLSVAPANDGFYAALGFEF